MVKNFGIKLMGKVKNWVKKKAAIVSLALANVEKNAFSQTGESLSSDVNQERRHTQGQLADSLVHGEVTQEVIDLRWRTYKVLKETEGVVAEITGYDDDGMPIVKTRKKDKKVGLDKIKIDPTDPYPLEIVVDNTEITLSISESINNVFINTNEMPKIESETFIDEKLSTKKEEIALHGGIASNEFFASHKTDKPITINRLFFPKFYIENFTKKLNVRTIDDKNKMLEFYVSIYPDEYNKNSNLFLKEIKKAIENPITSNMLEIKDVGFISYKTIGVDDFLEYKYEINSFDKIVEFNGYYVIKFLASVVIDGDDVLEKHRVAELDKKYENKERKK
jgi:hypothetical protein